MKIPLRELKACERGLVKLVNADLPAQISFRLTTILKTVRENLQQMEKIRTDLIRTYGSEQKDGSTRIEPGSQGEVKFKEEFEALLDEVVVIGNYTHLTIEDITEARISAVELEPLIGSFINPLHVVNSEPVSEH